MKYDLYKAVHRLLVRRSLSWQLYRVLTVCAAVVVFWTTYAMILPAITWDKMLICEMQEHAHDAACYDGEDLVCLLPEHIHVDACYDAPPADRYQCGRDEHTHYEECYFSDGSISCTQEEHTHDDDCLAVSKVIELELNDAEGGQDEYISSEMLAQADEQDEQKNELISEFDEEQKLSAESDEEQELSSELALEDTAPGFMLSPVKSAALFSARSTEVPDIITEQAQANEWQVVSGRYSEGTEQTRVITDDDGNVLRLRKNLVPTGTENEFYVYMTVEPVYYHDWAEIFKGSGMLVNNANKQTTLTDGAFSNEQGVKAIKSILCPPDGKKMTGHSSLLVSADKYPMTNWYTEQPGTDIFIDTIELQRTANDPNPIVVKNASLVFALSQQSSGSFTIVYSAPNSTKNQQLSNIWWDGGGLAKNGGKVGNGGLLRFPPEAYRALIESNANVFDHILQRTYPKKVTDPMGDHIQFLEVVGCSTGVNTVSVTNNVLTWDMSRAPITDPSQNPEDYERINTDDAYSLTGAYQLIYKIRLDVTDDGFVSCANKMNATVGETVNAANGTTTVTYNTDTHPSTTRTATFFVPEVRGLLYDVEFKKLDERRKPLAGAKFTLTSEDGSVTRTITTTGEDKTYIFKGLPCGNYTLTEEPPKDYTAKQTQWSVPLCYTTDPGMLNVNGADMAYVNSKEYEFILNTWIFLNEKLTWEHVFRKVGESNEPLENAQFKLYEDAALTKEVDAGFIPSKENGIFTSGSKELAAGQYYLVETVSPAGYMPASEPGVLTVLEDRQGMKLLWGGKLYTAEKSVQQNRTTFTIDVVNTKAVPLPQTGGTGMDCITLLGILVLMSTALFGILLCRGQKAGDYRE